LKVQGQCPGEFRRERTSVVRRLLGLDFSSGDGNDGNNESENVRIVTSSGF
jgi:hypothetical protein